jgi:hypothetical protein
MRRTHHLPRLASLTLVFLAAHAYGDERPTREFEVRGDRPYLGGEPVKLWGVRCNNALMSQAVTERLVNNLDNWMAHGVNLLSVGLQGTNGGFPSVDAGPNAFTRDGRLIPAFGERLKWLIREADRRGMVVCVGLFMPRKDELLKDEEAIHKGMDQVGLLLTREGLRNVFVNIYQEFNHPTRADHEIFREPDGAAKKAKLTAWWKAAAPGIEAGICPNHLSGSSVDYPGCDLKLFHEAMPFPEEGFAVNTETPDRDASGYEGVFNRFHLAAIAKECEAYRDQPRLAMLFRSPYVEDVTGVQGTGPNFEAGGDGSGDSERGFRPYLEWLRAHVGRWEYPRHVLDEGAKP